VRPACEWEVAWWVELNTVVVGKEQRLFEFRLPEVNHEVDDGTQQQPTASVCCPAFRENRTAC